MISSTEPGSVTLVERTEQNFYWLMKTLQGKKVRISSSIALVVGHQGVIVEGNPFCYAVIWKEGWTDIRGRLAFSFQGKVRRIETEVQFFHSYLLSS